MSTSNLRIIKLIDPALCIPCPAAYIALVAMSDGRRERMLYCTRRDCDNWIAGEHREQPKDKEQPMEPEVKDFPGCLYALVFGDRAQRVSKIIEIGLFVALWGLIIWGLLR